MKKPCANCPFLKEGAIDLREGRLRGIVQDLIADDRTPFVCHKTLSGEHMGSDGDDCEVYVPGAKDSVCVGSMVFLLKAQSPNVAMRLGAALGLLSFDELRQQFDRVVEVDGLVN